MLNIFKKEKKVQKNKENVEKNTEPTDDSDKCEVTGKIVIDTASIAHIGTREYQQDACFVSPPTPNRFQACAVLCDGMGGMHGGGFASSTVVEYFSKALNEISDEENIPYLMEDSAIAANEMISSMYADEGLQTGTTLTCAVIKDRSLYWVSVGDSRIYLVRGSEIARLTRDHDYSMQLADMVLAGLITQEEADNNPKKAALVSYIGVPTLEILDLSYSPFILEKDDTILLCSDGITKVLDDSQILQILSQNQSAACLASNLISEAMADTTVEHDNTSVVLMKYLG